MKDFSHKILSDNRQAGHNYFLLERFEAGMVLTGTEVKAAKDGKVQLKDAYASVIGNEAWLVNAHISQYSHGNRENHPPVRNRKLLLHRREMGKLLGSIRREGITIVPLAVYFNPRGVAKVQLGLAKGKRKTDKREADKARDWQRQKARLMRNKG